MVVNIDHHHDNTRFGTANLVVAEASSTAELLADVFAELGVALTPAIAEALYTGPRDRYRPVPVREHDAEGVAARGRAARGRGRPAAGVPGRVRVDAVREGEAARAGARAGRAATSSGRVVVSYLLRGDFGEVGAVEPYSEGIIDVLRAVEGAELAALIREPPRDGSPLRKISLRSSTRSCRRLRDRAKVERRRPSPGGRVLERPLDRRDHRLHRVRVRRPPGRAA